MSNVLTADERRMVEDYASGLSDQLNDYNVLVRADFGEEFGCEHAIVEVSPTILATEGQIATLSLAPYVHGLFTAKGTFFIPESSSAVAGFRSKYRKPFDEMPGGWMVVNTGHTDIHYASRDLGKLQFGEDAEIVLEGNEWTAYLSNFIKSCDGYQLSEWVKTWHLGL